MLFRKYWAGWTALALTAVMFFAAGALAQDAQSAPPAAGAGRGRSDRRGFGQPVQGGV